MPKVSVIIPCFNSSKTIFRCLKSVLQQTFNDFEVIVVDDGSIDVESTYNIISSFNDSRIRFIRHSINRNGSAARNTGFDHSKGQFIALLDSDDIWFPNHLQKYNDLVTNMESDELFIFYCKCKVNGIWNNYFLPRRPLKNSEKVSEYLFANDGFICTPALFFPKQLTFHIRFNEKLKRHQDYDFILRAEEIGKVKFIYSDHIGVEIFWQNNNIVAKGGGADKSLEWILTNRKFMNKSAISNFILKNVVWVKIRNKEKFKALVIMVKYCNPFLFHFKSFINTIKLFINL